LVFWQAGTVAGFDELVTEALTVRFSRWDFSWPVVTSGHRILLVASKPG
jgi:hypothetical protein